MSGNHNIKFTLENLSEAAKKFIDTIGDDRIFLFEGEMGSGKTTFITEVCKQLGATDHLGSPTFSLVNEYNDAEGNPVYHFDLYRIESPREALEMGAEEYFDSGEFCFVEWPDRLENIVPENARIVTIKVNEDGSRVLGF
ncbi:MAG: tRNA (adenosine(37)-N6)-threonylcarbamoyltransferase complex ATPase subunit type 1 TsaE [Muribaculaceae bacterium]|nr:tRNA (adenosine(37)-N6)-threonylcarbamoyltransferase complex ATPase subunit type 1 TsaE [Muribaculaceae bacterium]